MTIADDFETTLKATIERFNGFAKAGKDLDFHRGERQVELLFNGPAAEKPGSAEPDHVSDQRQGSLLRGAADRRQPRHQGRSGDQRRRPGARRIGKPIPGLYGVGNCVASASARAYWAGGATLGPILAFAYLAANAANREPRR